jgi:hypothetical protein
MEFSPELIALVTFGLLLNAGMLEEVQQASTLTMTWLTNFLAGALAFSGMAIIAAQLSGLDLRLNYLVPPLMVGGYGVFWSCMRISRFTHVEQLSRQPGPSPDVGGCKALLPLRLVVSAVVGASAVLLACAVLHEPAEPAGNARETAAAAGPSHETHDQE